MVDDPTAPAVLVALLRAVNVGGRRLAMSELRSVCEAAGHSHVRTYVQSGNVVLATDQGPAQAAADLERRLAEHCGFEVPVVVRRAEEISATIEGCPFDRDADPTRLVVAFGSAPLGGDALGTLDPDGFGAERLAVVGRDVYLWLPEGQGRSPLAQAFGRTPAGRASTARNWRTVLQLEAMAAELVAALGGADR